METILIATDFSSAARHALDYACMLFSGKDVSIELLHISAVPVTYTTDGLALAAMQHEYNRAEERMENEVAHVSSGYPAMKVDGRIISGSFLDCLRHEAKTMRPLFLVLGTAGFADILPGEEDPLNALRAMHAPVLFVPQGAGLRPIHKLAYACNYAIAGPRIPVRDVIKRVQYLDAHLQVVHIDARAEGLDAKQSSGKAWLQEKFQPLAPSYLWIEDRDILHGLSDFILRNDVDCLMAIPHRHGFWQNFFHNSRTKALARLNKVPILTFPEIV